MSRGGQWTAELLADRRTVVGAYDIDGLAMELMWRAEADETENYAYSIAL